MFEQCQSAECKSVRGVRRQTTGTQDTSGPKEKPREADMGFADLLDEVGGFGRFQLIHVTLLSIPGLLMASQNLLNNFTAGTPMHHCTVPNMTSALNLSVSEEDEVSLLRAFVPEAEAQLSKCSRFVRPQWHLIASNHTLSRNRTEVEMEGCVDGWTYERTEFISTIVSEVRELVDQASC